MVLQLAEAARLVELPPDVRRDRIEPEAGALVRLQRDQLPLQAEYLARGDEDGFEQRFGKL